MEQLRITYGQVHLMEIKYRSMVPKLMQFKNCIRRDDYNRDLWDEQHDNDITALDRIFSRYDFDPHKQDHLVNTYQRIAVSWPALTRMMYLNSIEWVKEHIYWIDEQIVVVQKALDEVTAEQQRLERLMAIAMGRNV